MRVFLDANVILDKYDEKRPSHMHSVKTFEYLIENAQIFTSCDLITTIYYIDAKNNKEQALNNIFNINKTLKVIEFSNKEIEETCDLMIHDKSYEDLEDTLQYIMAKKYQCDMIISNDKRFMSKEIELVTSGDFYKRYISE